MTIQNIEGKETLFFPSLENEIEGMLQRKFHVRREDFDNDEWKDLMIRFQGTVENSKHNEVFDNVRHEAGNFLMTRANPKCAVLV